MAEQADKTTKPKQARGQDREQAPRLTHSDGAGGARMVDVGGKDSTKRVARAQACVLLSEVSVSVLATESAEKGNVLGTAQLAGIMAAKQTSALIPLCHPLPLSQVSVSLRLEGSRVVIFSECRTQGQTGVEMEALTAVSVAALTVYDMLKAVDRGMRITDIRLLEKSGGASGAWHAEKDS